MMKLDLDDDACNAVVKDGEIPEKWNGNWMVNVCKGIVLHRLIHYITLSSFHTPCTPKAISGASAKLQMSFQLPFEKTRIIDSS